MTHRQKLKEYLSEISITDSYVFDWGSGSKPAFRYIANDIDNIWVTIDNALNIAPDRKATTHVTHDITKPIKYGQADVAFCLEVLEHVENFDAVIENIYDNMRKGGTLYLSAPFKYVIHADADYWRFTAHGIKLLLARHGFSIEYIKNTVDELGYFVKAVK